MEIDGVPVTTEAFPRTVRLVTTARLRAAVLAALVDGEDELADLAEIEGATGMTFSPEVSGEYSLRVTIDGCTRLSEPVYVTVTVTG